MSWPNTLIRSLPGQSPKGVSDFKWLIRRTDVLFGQDSRRRRPRLQVSQRCPRLACLCLPKQGDDWLWTEL